MPGNYSTGKEEIIIRVATLIGKTPAATRKTNGFKNCNWVKVSPQQQDWQSLSTTTPTPILCITYSKNRMCQRVSTLLSSLSKGYYNIPPLFSFNGSQVHQIIHISPKDGIPRKKTSRQETAWLQNSTSKAGFCFHYFFWIHCRKEYCTSPMATWSSQSWNQVNFY